MRSGQKREDQDVPIPAGTLEVPYQSYLFTIQAYLGYCVTPSNYELLAQDTSPRERVEKKLLDLADNSVDL
jgi:hypothetical protein